MNRLRHGCAKCPLCHGSGVIHSNTEEDGYAPDDCFICDGTGASTRAGIDDYNALGFGLTTKSKWMVT